MNITNISSKECINIVSTKIVDGMHYKCIYCTLDIKSQNPIGCPLSQLTEMIIKGKHTETDYKENYITFGIFCSYSCVKAYILEHSHDPTFSKSLQLLSQMYRYEYDKSDPFDIIPSPSPLLMSDYGGYMSVEQYESEKGKITYVSNGHVVTHPVSSIYVRLN
jgi:hypothetical protein